MIFDVLLKIYFSQRF